MTGGVTSTSRSRSGRRSVPGIGQVARRGAGLGVRVDDRELDLVLVGAEVHEQLVDVVEDLVRAGVAAVDLVDRDDDRQAAGHRLLEDVAGLRQRTLGGVDEEQHRIDHQQRALDLAAEVGVAGRVDDVEPDPGVVDRRLLGEDRDALLALEVARIETRSTTAWLERKAPVWRSIASTSVVLPWSTCATMATLRRSARVAVAARGEVGSGRVRGSRRRARGRWISRSKGTPDCATDAGPRPARPPMLRRWPAIDLCPNCEEEMPVGNLHCFACGADIPPAESSTADRSWSSSTRP